MLCKKAPVFFILYNGLYKAGMLVMGRYCHFANDRYRET